MTQHALDIQKLGTKFEGNTKKQQDIVKNQGKYNDEITKQNKVIKHLTSQLQKQQEEIKKCNKELEKHGEDIDRVQRKCNDNSYKLSSMYGIFYIVI